MPALSIGDTLLCNQTWPVNPRNGGFSSQYYCTKGGMIARNWVLMYLLLVATYAPPYLSRIFGHLSSHPDISASLQMEIFIQRSFRSWAFNDLLIDIPIPPKILTKKKQRNYFASSDPHHGIQFIPSDILSGISI